MLPKRYLIQSEDDTWREYIRYDENDVYVYLICISPTHDGRVRIRQENKRKHYFYHQDTFPVNHH